tara:strand:- start:7512 stop:8237 length:726 start_codon:yes stop_codon:yes gene_type:complete
MKKVINQVMQTNDYSLFKKMKGNRDVNIAHHKRLKKSIEEESLQVPIIVNEKMEICDGQTRFGVWKELKLPVIYIVVKGYSLPQVQRLNSNIKNWTLKDFADCYCDLNNKNYLQYRDFVGKYGLGGYESIAMLSGTPNGSGKNFERFKTGQFKVKSYRKACKEAEKVIQMEQYYEGYKRRSFVFALLQLINNKEFDFAQLLQKLSYQSTKLVHCTNKIQYLSLLQDIYNYNSKKKVNLMYS